MDEKLQKLIPAFGANRVKLDEPLDFYTSSRLSIKAEAFFIATTTKELIDITKAAEDLRIPYQIMGSGTKMDIRANLIPGLLIKNRTSGVKISGVKGKVGQNGIGVEEALVEVDSGVSLGRINQFLTAQKLLPLQFVSSLEASLGGSLLIESPIHHLVQSVRVLKGGEIKEIEVNELKKDQIILSAVLKIRA